MRVLGAAAVLVLTAALVGPTGPARAQSQTPHVNLLSDQPSKTPEEKEADAAKEKAYKESLKKIPDAKAPSDPWGSVRSDAPKTPAKSEAKSAAKSASTVTKSKTKAGGSAN